MEVRLGWDWVCVQRTVDWVSTGYMFFFESLVGGDEEKRASVRWVRKQRNTFILYSLYNKLSLDNQCNQWIDYLQIINIYYLVQHRECLRCSLTCLCFVASWVVLYGHYFELIENHQFCFRIYLIYVFIMHLKLIYHHESVENPDPHWYIADWNNSKIMVKSDLKTTVVLPDDAEIVFDVQVSVKWLLFCLLFSFKNNFPWYPSSILYGTYTILVPTVFLNPIRSKISFLWILISYHQAIDLQILKFYHIFTHSLRMSVFALT